MESVITLLISILTMRHCSVAPLSAAVTFIIVMLDGFGPKVVSVDVTLTKAAFRDCPKTFENSATPGSAVILQTRMPNPIASQENVRSSPAHASSLSRCRVTERGKIESL